MIIEKELLVKLRGNRNYVHSTNLFFEASNLLSSSHDGFLSKLAFKKNTENKVKLTTILPSSTEIVAACIWTAGAEKIKFWIAELDSIVREYEEYDEEPMELHSDLKGSSISCCKIHNFTTIDIIVGLTKILNNNLDPLVGKKWLFGEISLNQSLDQEYEVITIERKQFFKGKFSSNEVTFDDRCVGTLKFIAGQI